MASFFKAARIASRIFMNVRPQGKCNWGPAWPQYIEF